MELPIILINLKRITGQDAKSLINEINPGFKKYKNKFKIGIIIQPLDLKSLSKSTDFEIYIHDINLTKPLFEILDKKFIQDVNLSGILINHPENKCSEDILNKNYHSASSIDLKVVFAATNLDEAIKINNTYSPTYIAIEREDLIGKNISIKDYCPEIVTQSTKCISNQILFGAGIRTNSDISFVIQSGGAGVLIASAITKSSSPYKAMQILLDT